MPEVAFCAEAAVVTDAHELWAAIREAGIAAVERDRLMAEAVCDAVLRHSDFPAALARIVSRKLADHAISAGSLATLFVEAMREQPAICASAMADIAAIRDRDPACPDLLTPFLFFKGFHALQTYRFAHHLWSRGRIHLALHLQGRSSDVFAVDIHPAATLGQGILLDHGTGIVIGETAVIEDDVSILQGVTLGGTGKAVGDRHPKVRRGVLIGAGAKILGAIEIGQGAKIGAGSIVLETVHSFTTVVGNPARVVGTRHTTMPALTMDQSLPAPDFAI